MIRRALILALALGAALAHAQEISWTDDEKAAFAKAKAQHQLVMVDIFSKTDQLSKRFDDGTLKFPEVVALSKELVSLHSDPMKDGKPLAIKYSVLVLPTVLFLAPDGRLVSKMIGYETGPDFVDSIHVALDSFKEFDAMKAEATKNPKDGEANAKYATFLSSQVDPTLRQSPPGAPYLEHALASSYKGPYLILALESVADGYAMVPGKDGLAMAYYQKALGLAKTPAQKAKAMIAVVYMQMDTNKKAARALAQQIIDMKDAPPEWAYEAKVAISEIDKG